MNSRLKRIENLILTSSEALEEAGKLILEERLERCNEKGPAEAEPIPETTVILPHEPKYLKPGERIVPENFWVDPVESEAV